MKTARQKRAAFVRVAMERAKRDPVFRRKLIARIRVQNLHKLIQKADEYVHLHEVTMHDAMRTLSKMDPSEQQQNAQFLLDAIKKHLPDMNQQIRLLKLYGAR